MPDFDPLDLSEDDPAPLDHDCQTLFEESARIRAEVRAAASRHFQAMADLTKTLAESKRLLTELQRCCSALPDPSPTPTPFPSALSPSATPEPHAIHEPVPPAIPEPAPSPQILFVKRGVLYQC